MTATYSKLRQDQQQQFKRLLLRAQGATATEVAERLGIPRRSTTHLLSQTAERTESRRLVKGRPETVFVIPALQETDVPKGTRIRVLAGSEVYTTGPAGPRTVPRTYQVTVDHTLWLSNECYIVWGGAGGYWCRTLIQNATIVKGR